MTHVVDANCWCRLVDEQIDDVPGIGTSLFDAVEKSGGFLFDSGSLMRQEYIDVKKPYAEEIFNNWFTEKQIYGLARLVEIRSDPAVYKALIAIGMPKDDHVYIKTAIHGKADYLISIDSDFYDPSHKTSCQDTKLKIVKSGKGPVCKFLKKGHGVVVCCPETYLSAA